MLSPATTAATSSLPNLTASVRQLLRWSTLRTPFSSCPQTCKPAAAAAVKRMLYGGLAEADPEVHALIEREKERQFRGLELIASEVHIPMVYFSYFLPFPELYVRGCDGG